MGLSIYYNGKFNPQASLSAMIEEVKDVAIACNWEYHIYQETFPTSVNTDTYNNNIYGISLTPPECAEITFTFLSNRRMTTSTLLKFYGKTEEQDESPLLYMLSSKTQFAGPDIHKFIIEFFRYLHKKGYFENLEITDDGKYWETSDEKQLDEIFKTQTDMLESFSLAIESSPKDESEDFEHYFSRLMEMIQNIT